jgi:hypothetical protein
MREEPSRDEPSSTQSEQLELVGGPFCGSILRGSTGCFELGCAISTPCIRDNSPRQTWHLDAVYMIDDDYKGIFQKYVPSEF